MKKSDLGTHILERAPFVQRAFVLVIFIICIATSLFINAHLNTLHFKQQSATVGLNLKSTLLLLQSSIEPLQHSETNHSDIVHYISNKLDKKLSFLDVNLILGDGTYYGLTSGNPAQNYLVTLDDTDYASAPRSLDQEEFWQTYFVAYTDNVSSIWPSPFHENALIFTTRLHHRNPKHFDIVSISLPIEFITKNSTLYLAYEGELTHSIEASLNEFDQNSAYDNHWTLHRDVQFYNVSLLPLAPFFLILIWLGLRKKLPESTKNQNHADLQPYLCDELGVLVFETDSDSNILWFEGKLSAVSSLFQMEIDLSIKQQLKDNPRYLTYWQHSVSGEKLTYEIEDNDHALRVHQLPLYDSKNKFSGMGVFIQDISEQRAIEHQLQHQQFHDDLTGLPNRQLFLEQIQHQLHRAKRKQEFVAVLAMEVSGIGHINKTHGHELSDQLLKRIANDLKTVLRSEDTLCRFSADEFLISFDDYHQPDELKLAAERLIEAASSAKIIKDQSLKLTANIGIATYPRDARDVGSLVSNAITAMRHARQTGRNTLDYFSADTARVAHDKWKLEQDISKAINAHDFLLHYQPIFQLETNKCIGAEALIRWPSTNLSPDQFIPLAEETGLIHSIGLWVIESAIQQFMKWKQLGSDIQYLSINLSVLQLDDAEFFIKIDDILKHYPISKGDIILEITESVMMQTNQAMVQKLHTLKERGFSLAIDDFGTGFSSLNYLKHLPVDYLKIDRSFINGVPQNTHDLVICEAIIQMAQAMGLKLIAEGVETPEQMRWLNSHGVKSAQGYFYAKAVSADDFGIYLGV
jgi:diguanylate cyclase (GGDEF)-like protein